jgi:hypothetical protein
MATFLDRLSASDRRAIGAIAQEGGTSLTARMVRAVYVELLAAKVYEDEVLTALAADHRDDLERLTEGWVRIGAEDPPPAGA